MFINSKHYPPGGSLAQPNPSSLLIETHSHSFAESALELEFALRAPRGARLKSELVVLASQAPYPLRAYHVAGQNAVHPAHLPLLNPLFVVCRGSEMREAAPSLGLCHFGSLQFEPDSAPPAAYFALHFNVGVGSGLAGRKLRP